MTDYRISPMGQHQIHIKQPNPIWRHLMWSMQTYKVSCISRETTAFQSHLLPCH